MLHDILWSSINIILTCLIQIKGFTHGSLFFIISVFCKKETDHKISSSHFLHCSTFWIFIWTRCGWPLSWTYWPMPTFLQIPSRDWSPLFIWQLRNWTFASKNLKKSSTRSCMEMHDWKTRKTTFFTFRDVMHMGLLARCPFSILQVSSRSYQSLTSLPILISHRERDIIGYV